MLPSGTWRGVNLEGAQPPRPTPRPPSPPPASDTQPVEPRTRATGPHPHSRREPFTSTAHALLNPRPLSQVQQIR